MTILFGLVTRLPFAFAAGLGINAFLAFSSSARSAGPRRWRSS
jgi:xanthine/uracil/vitamin C permease (AzgA family)